MDRKMEYNLYCYNLKHHFENLTERFLISIGASSKYASSRIALLSIGTIG